MTDETEFLDNVRKVARVDGRYDLQAYVFVFEALDFTLKRIGKRRHVTGSELLEGIREFALKNFGGMGRVVFNSWGIRATADFGNIVFLLVEAGLMSKTETDSLDDFLNGFDFSEVFEHGYSPRGLARPGDETGGKSPKNA